MHKQLLAFGFLTVLLTPVHAATECRALHPSGKTIPVKQESGETYEAYALASWLPYGPPTIYYGKRYAALSELQQRFVQHKECAHLSVPTVDEVQAACHGLKALRAVDLSAQDEQQLAAWLAGEGAKGFAYRGTPQAFWDAIAACAGAR
jgi:hypothetical protein